MTSACAGSHSAHCWVSSGGKSAAASRLAGSGAGVADWPFDQPAFLILNVAVGGNLGGNVDPGLLSQMTLSVDWVKVWQP